jgi:hypothetical protein
VHILENIHVGTLRIHSCEQKLAHAHVSHAYMHQFMTGIHQQLLQPAKTMAPLPQFVFLFQAKIKMNEE